MSKKRGESPVKRSGETYVFTAGKYSGKVLVKMPGDRPEARPGGRPGERLNKIKTSSNQREGRLLVCQISID